MHLPGLGPRCSAMWNDTSNPNERKIGIRPRSGSRPSFAHSAVTCWPPPTTRLASRPGRSLPGRSRMSFAVPRGGVPRDVSAQRGTAQRTHSKCPLAPTAWRRGSQGGTLARNAQSSTEPEISPDRRAALAPTTHGCGHRQPHRAHSYTPRGLPPRTVNGRQLPCDC